MRGPCAYYDPKGCLSLAEHNTNVAGALHALFYERLRPQTPLATRISEASGVSEPLYKAAMLAAISHDVGKASPYYQENLAEEGSFYLHEHVSAAILYEAMQPLIAEGLMGPALILLMAAGAVSRHHAAMRGRHPNDLERDTVNHRRIARALAVMGREHLESAIMPGLIPRDLRGLLLEGVDSATKHALESGANYAWSIISNTTSSGLKSANMVGKGKLTGDMIVVAVQAIAGALIVADILVAGAERRGLGDPSRAYSLSWQRELNAHEVIKAIVSGSWDRGVVAEGLEGIL